MIPILVDYETLRFAWWVLLGVLLIAFAIMDGFDMGIAFLNPILGRTDTERRIIINTVGPIWEGNQVWLILGAGAIFAAFPAVYAVAFSGFYCAMLLVLLSLIVRPVSFEYRNKFAAPYRHYCDYALFTSGLVPPLIFGIAFGNLFQGVPFFLDASLKSHYVSQSGVAGWFGGLFGLLNPFALLCGIVSVAMLTVQGGVYLAAKTITTLQKKATKAIYFGLLIWLVAFIISGIWVGSLEGYHILSPLNHASPSNPTTKEVVREVGGWFNNYYHYPLLYLVPGLAVISCIMTGLLTWLNSRKWAFVFSSLMIATTIITAGVALFPMLLPSSVQPNQSLTVWDASSSHLTLWLMTIAAVIFVPIILLYTRWVYRVMRGPITEEYIEKNKNSLY